MPPIKPKLKPTYFVSIGGQKARPKYKESEKINKLEAPKGVEINARQKSFW